MRKTTIYRFHAQGKTYVFADRRTPEQIIEYYSRKYEKRKAVNNYQGFRYELFEHGTPNITAIEEYEGTRGEIKARVQHYREHFNCVSLNPDSIERNKKLLLKLEEENRKRAKQYYYDNKGKLRLYGSEEKERARGKQYYQKNKEKINARKRERYYANKEKNKEKMNARVRERREKNKEKINARKREKITCECGAVITRGYMSRHKNTKKHKKNMPAPEKMSIEDELIEILPKELLGIVEEYTRPLNFDTAPELSSIVENTADVKVGDLLIVQYYPETVSVQKIIDSTEENWVICFCDVEIDDPPPDHPMKEKDGYLFRLNTVLPLTDGYKYKKKKTKPVKKIKTGSEAFIFISLDVIY